MRISVLTKVTERSVTLWRTAWTVVVLGLGRLLPRWSGELTMWAFSTPLTRRRQRDEMFDTADSFELPGGIQGWKWGEGPAVYLVHGWQGSTSQMLSWVPGLVRRGFSVVAIDQAAHGHSKGWSTNAVTMAAALNQVADRVGQPVAIVAHSLGGIVAHHAIAKGLQPRAAVLLSSPTQPEPYFRRMLKLMRFRNPDAVVRAAERVLGLPFSDFIIGPALEHIPTLLIHDANDREVPVTAQRAIAASLPYVRALQTQGLGHNRILRDAGVIESGTRFISETLGDADRYEPARPPSSPDTAPLITAEELWLDLSYGR